LAPGDRERYSDNIIGIALIQVNAAEVRRFATWEVPFTSPFLLSDGRVRFGSIERETYRPVNALLPTPMSLSGRCAWLLRWRADQRKTIYLCALVLASCAAFLVIYLQKMWLEYNGQLPGYPDPFGDFFALWSYAKIASTHSAADLYDLATLHARQVALGMAPHEQNPFPYPPTFIALLWPLSLLPYGVAYLVWTIGTLALFAWAVWATCSRLPLSILGVIIAPTSVVTIASGQSGFLAAAMIIAGIRLAGSKPILSGILIGILSYKPQLGLLVHFALASAGLWSAFGVACATVMGLAVVATFAFGWDIWSAWISMLPTYADMFDRDTVGLKFMPTVVANLKMAGFPLPMAKGVQLLAAIIVTVLVSGCFRRNPTRLAAAALLVGTFLATPHAFVYDMPMITAAMALFIEARLEANPVFSLAEILILVLALMFPVLMVTSVDLLNLPVSFVALLLLFGLIVRHERRRIPARATSMVS
jgi:hypothetical protein